MLNRSAFSTALRLAGRQKDCLEELNGQGSHYFLRINKD